MTNFEGFYKKIKIHQTLESNWNLLDFRNIFMPAGLFALYRYKQLKQARIFSRIFGK